MTNYITVALATKENIAGVLALQARNLVTNLTEDEMKNGFVTTPFTAIQLEKLISEEGLFVAKDKEKVVSYVCTGTWEFFNEWEMFRFLAARLPLQTEEFGELTLKNTFQYGPVCVDAAYRGKGILPQIFDLVKQTYAPKFPVGMTFINKLNPRSYKAHTEKLLLKVITDFQFNNKNYYELAFFTK